MTVFGLRMCFHFECGILAASVTQNGFLWRAHAITCTVAVVRDDCYLHIPSHTQSKKLEPALWIINRFILIQRFSNDKLAMSKSESFTSVSTIISVLANVSGFCFDKRYKLG